MCVCVCVCVSLHLLLCTLVACRDIQQFEQLYVEREGPGDLRISTVSEGDSTVVGTIYIHILTHARSLFCHFISSELCDAHTHMLSLFSWILPAAGVPDLHHAGSVVVISSSPLSLRYVQALLSFTCVFDYHIYTIACVDVYTNNNHHHHVHFSLSLSLFIHEEVAPYRHEQRATQHTHRRRQTEEEREIHTQRERERGGGGLVCDAVIPYEIK